MQPNNEKIIADLIHRSYFEGALNAMDTDAMRKGYHPEFAIFFSEGNTLQRLTLDRWIQMVNTYKSDFVQRASGLRTMECEIAQIDVTGDAAFVKAKLFRKRTLIFTDYITLLKFDGEWRIVTKIYHAHIEKPWE